MASVQGTRSPQATPTLQGAPGDALYGLEYCRAAYLDLYVTLGNTLCDHAIEPGNGAYCRDPNLYMGGDRTFAAGLTHFLKAEGARSVIDFGAGGGWYADHLSHAGLSVQAYDGAVGSNSKPVSAARTAAIGRTGGFLNRHPFLNVTRLPLNFYHGTQQVPAADWVYCIEVAEHVPAQFEDVLVRNLVDHAIKGLVLTWATIGQKGHAHVNNKAREDVIALFASHGFVLDNEASVKLQDACTFMHLKRNLIVFRRSGASAA